MKRIDLVVLSIKYSFNIIIKIKFTIEKHSQMFLVKTFFSWIASEINITMIGFNSFLWKYNLLWMLKGIGIGIETHFQLMSWCFNLLQAVVNLIYIRIQITHFRKSESITVRKIWICRYFLLNCWCKLRATVVPIFSQLDAFLLRTSVQLA